MAAQSEHEAVCVQRSPAEKPRRGDDRRFRSGNGLATVELTHLYDRRREGDVDGVEPPPRGRRLFDELRAVQHHRAGRHLQDAWHAGVVHHHQQAGFGSGHAVERSGEQQRTVPGPLGDRRVGLIRVRRAQHQGRRSALVGPLSADARGQRRHPRDLPQRRGHAGADPQHAAQLVRQPARRLWDLRAGLLDDEAAHRQLRWQVGILRARRTRGDGTGRPLCQRAHLRADRLADLEKFLAARRGRLRPVRQPENRVEVQHRQVHDGGVHRILRELQPARIAVVDRGSGAIRTTTAFHRESSAASIRLPAASSISPSCPTASA